MRVVAIRASIDTVVTSIIVIVAVSGVIVTVAVGTYYYHLFAPSDCLLLASPN